MDFSISVQTVLAVFMCKDHFQVFEEIEPGDGQRFEEGGFIAEPRPFDFWLQSFCTNKETKKSK